MPNYYFKNKKKSKNRNSKPPNKSKNEKQNAKQTGKIPVILAKDHGLIPCPPENEKQSLFRTSCAVAYKQMHGDRPHCKICGDVDEIIEIERLGIFCKDCWEIQKNMIEDKQPDIEEIMEQKKKSDKLLDYLFNIGLKKELQKGYELYFLSEAALAKPHLDPVEILINFDKFFIKIKKLREETIKKNSLIGRMLFYDNELAKYHNHMEKVCDLLSDESKQFISNWRDESHICLTQSG